MKEGRGVCLWDDLQGGTLPGSETFVREMRPLLADASSSKEISRSGRLLAHPTLDEIFKDVGDDRVLRDQGIYKAFRVHGYTLFQIQEHLGIHYSTISRIAKRVVEQLVSKNKT